VTLAAVDKGILQLTKFRSPAPDDFYFGKRRLAVDIRDDYGRLIEAKGPVGALRSGGDAAGLGGRGLEVVPTRTVALVSGLVALDGAGRAKIPFQVPDFNGELRLMAVAFDATKLGRAEARLTVRDAVVSDVTLPRFLAPGDQSRIALSLHNVEGAAGDYEARLEAEGAVSLAAPGTRAPPPGGRRAAAAEPAAARRDRRRRHGQAASRRPQPRRRAAMADRSPAAAERGGARNRRGLVAWQDADARCANARRVPCGD